MVYTPLDTSVACCELGSKIDDLRKCMEDLPEEDAAKLEVAIIEVTDEYSVPTTAGNERLLWCDILKTLQASTSLIRVASELEMYMCEFKTATQFERPPPAKRPFRHAIAQLTITLSELMTRRGNYCLPRSIELEEVLGRGLCNIRNQLAHKYESRLEGPEEELFYNATTHYNFLRFNLPRIHTPLRNILARTIPQLRISVAHEIAHWDSEFREIAETQEADRQKEYMKRQGQE